MTRTAAALSALVLAAACAAKGEAAADTQAAQPEIMVACAQSLRGVMPALAAAFRAQVGGPEVTATFGASGDLRKQVEGGAPVDGVLFAGARPVDELIAGGHIDRATRRVLATNRLVLIGPRGGRAIGFESLDALPAGEKIAIGDPGAVPAGQYARAALQALGKWDALAGRLVLGGDVAAVLAYARRGEVAAAVVYRTETRGIDDIVVLDEARAPWAPRAEVVGAVATEARGAARARAFLEFVASPAGQEILAGYGFGPP
jgi:molybdate transport system substrate-binding protein